jgi:hypothetical protein
MVKQNKKFNNEHSDKTYIYGGTIFHNSKLAKTYDRNKK